ncbi:MAG: glycosyl hydrolase family 28 protein [bacterium]
MFLTKTQNRTAFERGLGGRFRRTVVSVCVGTLLTLTGCKLELAGGCNAVFDVRTFGAVGDGEALNTAAIQRAIDACSKAGGGTVRVKDGRYVTGTIRISDHVTFHIEQNAELLGSTNLIDYATNVVGAVEAPAFKRCLIYAQKAKNIAFSGRGLIDARGTQTAFPVHTGKTLGERPMLMRLVGCKEISFSDLTFKNSASWGLHLVDCDHVRFNRIRIESKDNNVNNDGIDLDGCQDVQIENCRINSGDDAICPKSTTLRPCSNIVVRTCELSSHTAGFKLGTSSRGGFVDIQVVDSFFHDCPMGAIKLLLVDGGRMENVLLSDLRMERVGGPIFIRLGNRGRAYNQPVEQIYAKAQNPEGVPVGLIRNIRIKNIVATVTGEQRDRLGLMLTGIPGHRIENVELENIQITLPGGGTQQEAAQTVPEDIARYPEQFFFGVLPSSFLYARHVKGLTLKNIAITFEKSDARPVFHTEDVENLRTTNVTHR